MLSHYLLASVVCDEKSALNFIEDPLHTIIQFDLNTSKILSWALTVECLTMIYLIVDYFAFILPWVCLNIRMHIFMFFIKLGEIFNHFSSNILSAIFPFSSGSGTLAEYMVLGSGVSPTFCLFIYLFFFVFLKLDNLNL